MSENNPEHHYITLPLMLHLSFEKVFLPAIIVPLDYPTKGSNLLLYKNFHVIIQYNPHFPANIRLDEDVLKTSFVFIFRRRLEDVFKMS